MVIILIYSYNRHYNYNQNFTFQLFYEEKKCEPKLAFTIVIEISILFLVLDLQVRNYTCCQRSNKEQDSTDVANLPTS